MKITKYSYSQESESNANHAGRTNISYKELMLVLEWQAKERSCKVVSREKLMEIAWKKNSTNLPALKSNQGLRLPPDRYTLYSQNYQLVEDRTMEVELPIPPPAASGNHPVS